MHFNIATVIYLNIAILDLNVACEGYFIHVQKVQPSQSHESRKTLAA